MRNNACKINLIYIANSKIYVNPLALGYLKTYSDLVFKRKVDVEITEYSMQKINNEIENVAQDITKEKPDIVVFSCYFWNIIPIINLSKEIKRKNEKIKIVFVGPEASMRQDQILKDTGGDAIILGEAELTFAELVERFISNKPWQNTSGSIVFSRGKIFKGNERSPIKDLENIPSPYLKGIFDGKKYEYWILETSRATTSNYTFCVWENKEPVRNFSISRVKQEINWLIKNTNDITNPENKQILKSSPKVFFVDQNLIMQSDRSIEILNHIKANIKDKELMWIMGGNLKYLTKDIAEAGNFSKMNFCFKIQSINYELVKELGSIPLTMSEMENKLELVKNWAPKARIILEIMLGIPGDTKKGFMATLNWCLEQCAKIQTMPVMVFHRELSSKLSTTYNAPLRTMIKIIPFSIFPNTYFEKLAKEKNVRWDKNPSYTVKGMDGFPEKDINYCYDLIKIFERFTGLLFENSIVEISKVI